MTGANRSAAPVAVTVARGALAGVAGTTAMTAFQRLVEMPLTGRRESMEPARLAERLLPLKRKRGAARRRRNYAVHFGIGLGWGAAHALLASRWDLHGPRGAATVFATLWPGDALGVAALGVHDWPWNWSARDAAVDLTDKFVLAQATGLAFDRIGGR